MAQVVSNGGVRVQKSVSLKALEEAQRKAAMAYVGRDCEDDSEYASQCEIRRISQVMENLESVERSLDILADHVGKFEHRLESVLRPQYPTPCEDERLNRDSQVPLAERLHSVNVRLGFAIANLVDMQERLEL